MPRLQSFTHRFTVRASLSSVAEFHRHASSMAAITPPPVIVRIHHAPDVLTEGSQMEFTMWLGPLPLYWKAIIEDVSENGFVDRQLKGPFAAWQHRHTFIALGNQSVPKSSMRFNFSFDPIRSGGWSAWECALDFRFYLLSEPGRPAGCSDEAGGCNRSGCRRAHHCGGACQTWVECYRAGGPGISGRLRQHILPSGISF
jgi:ligand-binding SRPBCC domain-containing protein